MFLKTIVAPEVTGINPETTVMTFEVPDENFDVVAACKKVAIAYCQTEAGKYDYLYMCNKNFNWGDFDLYVPASFIEQFGFRKIESKTKVIRVEHDENLVNKTVVLKEGE